MNFSLGAYLLASLLVFIDLIDFLVRYFLREVQTMAQHDRVAPTSFPLDIGEFSAHQQRLHLKPYAFLASVHNLGEEAKGFIDSMMPYRERLWLIDDASTDDTMGKLRSAGLRCVEGRINRLKPAAIKALLAQLPPDIETVIVFDPDCRFIDRDEGGITTIERVVFEFQRSHMAAACPRIRVRRDGWLVSLQRLEYCISFSLGRKSLGTTSITSGIALYRRDALAALLAEHSLSVYAEDLENTVRLLEKGERIYYDGRLVVETEGKRTLAGWFSQRVGWSFGLVKVYLSHLKMLWSPVSMKYVPFYQYVVYTGLFCLAMHPFKILSVVLLLASAANGAAYLLQIPALSDSPYANPWLFPLAYAKYTLLMLIAIPLCVSRNERREHAPVAFFYFFYSLLQIAPMTIGFLNWVSLRLFGHRLYRDHYSKNTGLEKIHG